ncbi:MAG: recombinase RarA, partial [Treponema sp.]|nr:recombinase RarA [Treponema sp.]
PLISQQIFASQKMDAETSRILIDMEKAEKAFFSDKNNRLFAWGPGDVEKIFSAQGFSVRTQRTALVEKRRIVAGEIEKWFDTENSSYGKAMCGAIGKESCEKIKSLLKSAAEKQIFTWKTENAFFTCGFGD